jgi:molybdopterin-guanine dinucleotide biosynthesis protein A
VTDRPPLVDRGVGIGAVLLAGGRAARLGGVSKPELTIDGVTLLDRSISAARSVGAALIVVVGPSSLTRPGVVVVSESPPFGGPVAGLASGLERLGRAESRDAPAVVAADEWVLVLPCDLPRAQDAAVLLQSALPSATDDVDGLCLVDADGRDQWLTALYRRSALDRAMHGLGELRGRSMRALVGGLALRGVPDPGGAGQDVDTWANAASHHARQPPSADSGSRGLGGGARGRARSRSHVGRGEHPARGGR